MQQVTSFCGAKTFGIQFWQGGSDRSQSIASSALPDKIKDSRNYKMYTNEHVCRIEKHFLKIVVSLYMRSKVNFFQSPFSGRFIKLRHNRTYPIKKIKFWLVMNGLKSKWAGTVGCSQVLGVKVLSEARN